VTKKLDALTDLDDKIARQLWMEQLRDILNEYSEYNYVGTGTPEGVVTARVGAIYHRTDNANALYVKQTGTGNTGWILK